MLVKIKIGLKIIVHADLNMSAAGSGSNEYKKSERCPLAFVLTAIQ